MARMLQHNPAPSSGKGMFSPVGITLVGGVGNIVLSAVKITAGLAFASQALLADGIHSLSDLASDLAILWGLKVSNRQADQCHPYGHRRVQTMVAMLIGVLVVSAAVTIGVTAGTAWHDRQSVSYGWVPFLLALGSVAIKEALYRVTRRVGRRSGDLALMANAWHHRSDAFSSLAAAVGMGGVALGGNPWAFLDHATAIAMAALLVVIGLKLMGQAAQELVDRAPARELLEGLASVLAETAGVRSHHAFRVRQLGGKLEMDVHIQVDPGITVAQGHEIASLVQKRIARADPNVTTVVVHVEPAEPT